MAEVPNEFDKLAMRLFSPNPMASDKVNLAYPTSTKFLRDLPEKHVSIIKKLNWDIPNTVHLGMPYFMGHPPIYEPTYSALSFVLIPEKAAYFRSICWTESFLKNAHPISLEESIYHEKIHIKEDEPRFRNAAPFTMEQRLEIGRETKRRSSEYVINKYGKRADDVLNSDTIKRYREQAKTKTIVGDIFIFWLRKFFRENFQKYEQNAIDLTPQQASIRITESVMQNDQSVELLYLSNFGFSIKDQASLHRN